MDGLFLEPEKALEEMYSHAGNANSFSFGWAGLHPSFPASTVSTVRHHADEFFLRRLLVMRSCFSACSECVSFPVCSFPAACCVSFPAVCCVSFPAVCCVFFPAVCCGVAIVLASPPTHPWRA